MAHRLAPSEERLLDTFVARLLAAVPAGAVRDIVVFGSRARGDSGLLSDLDVAVGVTADVDLLAMRRLAADAAHDAMQERDAFDLGLAPVVLQPGPLWGLRGAIARDGLTLWKAGS